MQLFYKIIAEGQIESKQEIQMLAGKLVLLDFWVLEIKESSDKKLNQENLRKCKHSAKKIFKIFEVKHFQLIC